MLLDLPHNTYEVLSDSGVIIRKGAVRVTPGDPNVRRRTSPATSRWFGRLTASPRRSNRLSHGTGRSAARGAAKEFSSVGFDFAGLRTRVLLPEGLADNSLRTEGPFAYHDLNPCLELLSGFVTLVERFAVIGWLYGHLG